MSERFDIALVIDEFQPVLKRHQEMLERASELADHVLICVYGDGGDSLDAPLDFRTRRNMINTLIADGQHRATIVKLQDRRYTPGLWTRKVLAAASNIFDDTYGSNFPGPSCMVRVTYKNDPNFDTMPCRARIIVDGEEYNLPDIKRTLAMPGCSGLGDVVPVALQEDMSWTTCTYKTNSETGWRQGVQIEVMPVVVYGESVLLRRVDKYEMPSVHMTGESQCMVDEAIACICRMLPNMPVNNMRRCIRQPPIIIDQFERYASVRTMSLVLPISLSHTTESALVPDQFCHWKEWGQMADSDMKCDHMAILHAALQRIELGDI